MKEGTKFELIVLIVFKFFFMSARLCAAAEEDPNPRACTWYFTFNLQTSEGSVESKLPAFESSEFRTQRLSGASIISFSTSADGSPDIRGFITGKQMRIGLVTRWLTNPAISNLQLHSIKDRFSSPLITAFLAESALPSVPAVSAAGESTMSIQGRRLRVDTMAPSDTPRVRAGGRPPKPAPATSGAPAPPLQQLANWPGGWPRHGLPPPADRQLPQACWPPPLPAVRPPPPPPPPPPQPPLPPPLPPAATDLVAGGAACGGGGAGADSSARLGNGEAGAGGPPAAADGGENAAPPPATADPGPKAGGAVYGGGGGAGAEADRLRAPIHARRHAPLHPEARVGT